MAILKIKDENGNISSIPAIKGDKGKSAYQYAQDGGYTGTEEEFAKKLAIENVSDADFSQLSQQIADQQKDIDSNTNAITTTNNNVKDLSDRVTIMEDAQKEAPNTVDSVEEMTDTSQQYILSTTNTVWAYGETEVDDTGRNLFNADEVELNVDTTGTARTGALAIGFIPVDVTYCNDLEYVVTVKGTGAKGASSSDSNPRIYRIQYFDKDYNAITSPSYLYTVSATQVDSETLTFILGSASAGGYHAQIGNATNYAKIAYFKFFYQMGDSTLTEADIPTDIVITTPEPKTRIDSGWYDTGVSAEDASTGLVEVSLQVNKNTENIASNTQRIGVVEDALSELDVTLLPDYWQTAIDALEETVKTKQSVGANALQFVWVSDIHGAGTNTNSNGAGTNNKDYIGQIARYAMDKFNIPFTVITGDIMSQASHTSEEDVWNEYEAIAEILKPITEDELLAMKGNHDGSWYGADSVYYLKNIGTKQIYNAIYRKQRKDRTRVFGDDGTYFYMEDDKTRYIMLNSHTDGDESVDANGYAVYNAQKNFVYGQKQLEWLINVALDNPNGKDIIVFGHPQIAQSLDGTLLSGILDAYNNRGTYSNSVTISADYWGTDVTDTTYKVVSVSVDFSKNVTGEVIAYFHGHNHKDNMNTTSFTFPSIGITTAGGDVRDADPVVREVGTATETALDIVTIDRENRNIYMTRIGAGADRETAY